MKRPFVYFVIFLTAGILSGQYTAILPYTALLALIFCTVGGMKKRSFAFILPFIVFIYTNKVPKSVPFAVLICTNKVPKMYF